MSEAYERICREWVTSEYDLRVYLELEELLSGRPGWHFDGPSESATRPVWCFGVEGACRLALSGFRGMFLLYDSAADEETDFGTAREVTEWLDAHEADYEGLTPLQIQLKESLERHTPEPPD